MPTTLQLNLSTAMQTWLTQGGSGNGVSAYAILYGKTSAGGTDSLLTYQTLVQDGVVQGGGQVALDLTTATQPNLFSGKAYIIIQSVGGTVAPIDPATLDQSAINWTSAAAQDFRYDSIEVSLTGTAGDAANLTEIEGYGINMTLVAATGSRGTAVPAATLITDLGDAATQTVAGKPAITTFTEGGLAGQQRQVVSPTVAVVPGNDYPLYQPGDWADYIEALKTPAAPIVVNGYFNGAPDQNAGGPIYWRNGGFFSYTMEWREGTGAFWLTPTAGSQIRGAIKLTPDDLANSIYSSLGSVELYTAIGGSTPVEIYPGVTSMNVGANNAWGKVLQQLTVGLTAGFFQSTGASANPAITGPIDLNKNYNWDPSYAFGTDTTTSLAPSVTTRWDPYAHALFPVSNAYGTQYGDALTAAFAEGTPLLPTYTGGANVTTLTATLYADSETSPPGSFTQPVIYNNVAGTGPGGQYAPAVWQLNNPSNITVNFNPGDSAAQSLVLRDDVQISIRILTGYSGTTPQWQDIAIGGGGVTPWQTWTFGYNSGSFTLTGNGGQGQTSQSLVLTGLPMADSGTGWYQIVVAGRGFEKTYNLYTTTYVPAGQAIPVFSDFGANPALFGVDGLATLTPGAANPVGGLLTFSVAVTGVQPTLDLALMQANTSQAYLNAQRTNTAPVAGMLQGGVFTALAGQTAAITDANGNGVPLSVASKSGLLAFGWTGLNDAPDTATWIETATNLIPGLSVGVVSVTGGAGLPSIAPLTAKADLLGDWQTTATQQLGNGTYTVSLSAYAAKGDNPSQPALDVPLTKASAPLTVTVSLADLALKVAGQGTALALQGDASGTHGNWIHFAAGTVGLKAGVSLALYATNASGQPVGPDGQPVASITDAILGWVGNVGADGGTNLLSGAQSVYLPAGQDLRVALLQEGSATPTPVAARVVDNGNGTLTVEAGEISLLAKVQNTLSAAAEMAAPQRIFGLPLLYLEQGQGLSVDVVGSAQNTNTLGFVRFDLDQATGALSIGGHAADGSAAFLAAVRAALDPGYGVTTGGGDFRDVRTWSVAGTDGYYAPVLVTQSGEVFVPGTGNADGRAYIRSFGENSFGFEDLAAAQGSDFDYNDMVMRLDPLV